MSQFPNQFANQFPSQFSGHVPPAYPQNVNMNVDAAGNVATELPCRKCGSA